MRCITNMWYCASNKFLCAHLRINFFVHNIFVCAPILSYELKVYLCVLHHRCGFVHKIFVCAPILSYELKVYLCVLHHRCGFVHHTYSIEHRYGPIHHNYGVFSTKHIWSWNHRYLFVHCSASVVLGTEYMIKWTKSQICNCAANWRCIYWITHMVLCTKPMVVCNSADKWSYALQICMCVILMLLCTWYMGVFNTAPTWSCAPHGVFTTTHIFYCVPYI